MIGIIMGSRSDLEIMQGASDILKELNIPFELTVGMNFPHYHNYYKPINKSDNWQISMMYC